MLLVLAGAADPAAVGAHVDLDLDRTIVVREPELHSGQVETGRWELVVLGGPSVRHVRAIVSRLDSLGTARELRVVVLATDRPWLQAAPGNPLGPVIISAVAPGPERVGTLALRLMGGAVDPVAVHARPSAAQREARTRARSVLWTPLARAARRAVEGQLRALAAVSVSPTDSAVVSPVGFDPLEHGAAPAPVVGLRRSPHGAGGLLGVSNGARVIHLASPGGLDERDVAALRPYRHVEIEATELDGPFPLAELLSQLLVAGVPVRVPALPLPVAALLGPRLAALLQAASPRGFGDLWRREEWSVAARREALQRFALGVPGHGGARLPAVSVVANAATAHEVTAMVIWLARQEVTAELVVGYGGPEAAVSQMPPNVALTVVRPVDGARVALRALTERSSHDVIAIADATQHYGRNHLRDLLVARAYSGVDAVASAGALVYLEPLDVTVSVQASPPERLASAAAPGTLLTSKGMLSQVGDGDEASAVAALADGPGLYVTHGLGVVRREAADVDGLRAVLDAGTRQWSGLVLPDDVRGADVGPPAVRVLAYRSYFAA